MKKLRLIPFFLFCMLAICWTGCSDDNEVIEQDSLEVASESQSTVKEGINLNGLGTDGQTVTFTASKQWTAAAEETTTTTKASAMWCTLSPRTGNAGTSTIKVSADKNDTGDTRAALVTVTSGTKSFSFKVTQKSADALTLTAAQFNVPVEGGDVNIEVKHNVSFSIEIDEESKTWISQANTRAMQTTSLTFKVAANEGMSQREGKIVVKSGDLQETITVTQEGVASTLPEGLSYSPETANADEALTIYYKADSQSALYNCTDDLYVHIGVGTEDGWEHVVTSWGVNEDKFKMTKVGDNIWSLAITPTIREWFASEDLPVNKMAIVIRNAASDKQTADLFITVTDNTYKPFEPAAMVEETMPSGLQEGINYIDNSTVTLVLYDKDRDGNHKEYAHVVGDFNNWTLANDATSQMKRDEAAGCWWITLTGLEATKEYAFQYYVGTKAEGSIRLADAYTEKILDPNNDKWITGTSYTYPEGARDIVSTFQIQQTAYTWKVSDFKIEEPDNLVIYEMHLRDFTSAGNLEGAKEKLDYLKTLGVNAIELMPIQEFDGNDSWGYNPCFFFAMDKAYGTKQQYKEFIDACHEQGMAVIVDVVYNHATGSHPFAKLYWDSTNNKTLKNNPWFNVDAPHPYSVFHDFDHESNLTRAFVKRNLQFLLTEYKIDGFRFDLTKGFTNNSSTESTASNYDASRIAILKDYNKAIKEVKEDAFVILEHFCDASEEKELAADGLHMWNNLNYAYCQTAMAWGSGSSFAGLKKDTPNWVGFMESHDEERMGYKQSMWGRYDMQTSVAARTKQLAINVAFFLTVPGPKMIWQFGELGYDVSINANQSGTVVENEDHRTDRKPIRWEYYDDADRKALYDVYCKLMKLRNENPELFDGATFTWNVTNETHDYETDSSGKVTKDEGNWYEGRSLYSESTTGKKLLVVGNWTDKEAKVAIPSAASTGTYTNYMTGTSETVSSTVTVPANSYIVYVNF